MKILISGAGIAGAAAAIYLLRDGHDVSLIDKARSFVNLGYGLALKSFGLSVMRDLGLEEELLNYAIQVDRIDILESSGGLINSCAAASIARSAHGAAMVYRSDLHRILYSALPGATPVRFSRGISGIVQDEHGVEATFSDGTTARFDLVIVAEGVRSSTRTLLWRDQGLTKYDVIYAAGHAESSHLAELGTMLWYLGPGASFTYTPVDENRALVQAYCRGNFDPAGSHADAKGLLLAQFRSFAPIVRRLLEQLDATGQIFYDNVAMVTLPILSQGLVVLLGDAAYCPTFLSGMGASLGLLGAKALQQSLRRLASDAPAALHQYNRVVQPIARHFQHQAAEHIGSLLTVSPTRLWIRDKIMHALPQAALGWAFGKQYEAETRLVTEILGT